MASTTKHFSYVRDSRTSQTLDRQLDALTEKGIDAADIFSSKFSGTRQSRPDWTLS